MQFWMLILSTFLPSAVSVCQKTNFVSGLTEGYITNDGWPDYYDNSSRCAWQVTVKSQKVIRFYLNMGSMKMCPRCECDFVELYDGAMRQPKTRVLIKACNPQYVDSFVTTSNVGTVYFVSGIGTAVDSSANNGQGFQVFFAEEDPKQLEVDEALVEKSGNVSGKLLTEQFRFGDSLTGWRNDLLDKSSPVYKEAKVFFESSLILMYSQAKISLLTVEVFQFRKYKIGDVFSAVQADYVAVIGSSQVPLSATETSLRRWIENTLNDVTVLLHQSGVFYEMFKNGPINDIVELVFEQPPSTSDNNFPPEYYAWIVVGSVLGLMLIVGLLIAFALLIKYNGTMSILASN